MSNVRILSSVPEPTLAQVLDGHTRPVRPAVVDVRDVVLAELSSLAEDEALTEIPWRF